MVKMIEEYVTISARIQRSQAEEVERLAAKMGVNRSTVIRELLSTVLQEQKLMEALELVRARKTTVWKAAEVAVVTYREMLDLLKMHNITFPLSKEELKREIEFICSQSHRKLKCTQSQYTRSVCGIFGFVRHFLEELSNVSGYENKGHFHVTGDDK